MPNRLSRTKFLNDLMTVKYATINNFYSPEAKIYKGSIRQSDIYIKALLKAGIIKKIPHAIRPTIPTRETFYCPTKLGAKTIGREDEYKDKDGKAINNAMHESMKIDIALTLIRSYRDYEFTFDYGKNISGLRPDIFVQARKTDGTKNFTFLVEIERKRDPHRTLKEKLKKYEEICNACLIPERAKVLVVYTNVGYNGYLRPQEYDIIENKEQIRCATKNFDKLVEISKELPAFRYRMIPFHRFNNLKEQIWIAPDKNLFNLI